MQLIVVWTLKETNLIFRLADTSNILNGCFFVQCNNSGLQIFLRRQYFFCLWINEAIQEKTKTIKKILKFDMEVSCKLSVLQLPGSSKILPGNLDRKKNRSKFWKENWTWKIFLQNTPKSKKLYVILVRCFYISYIPISHIVLIHWTTPKFLGK